MKKYIEKSNNKIFNKKSILILIIISVFIFSGVSIKNTVLALSGNYNKNTGESLNNTDWNNLKNDFLAKSGDTMLGNLNMGDKQINNLADPINDKDAVNKSFMDDAISNMIINSTEISDSAGSLRIFCGRTPPGATNWINSGGWYTDINISEANFTEGTMPYVFASIGGLNKHWFTSGVNNISSTISGTLNNLDDMFRVYVIDYNGISFDTMLSYGWYINWCAFGR